MNIFKDLCFNDKKEFDSWFYKADNKDLNEAIKVLNSQETLQKYPRLHIKEYISFAKALINGHQADPPLELDISSSSVTSFHNFAQGCYYLSETIGILIKRKLKSFINLSKLIVMNQSTLLVSPRANTIGRTFSLVSPRNIKFKRLSKSLIKISNPIISFAKTLNSVFLVQLNFAFKLIKHAKPVKNSSRRFKTKIEVKKILRKYVHAMIRQGRVNLQQRGFWRWAINAKDHNKLSLYWQKKEMAWLLKFIVNSADLRYFLKLKVKFQIWKEITWARIVSRLNCTNQGIMDRVVKKNKSKIKLKQKILGKNMNVLKFVYNHIKPVFGLLKLHAKKYPSRYFHDKKLKIIRPYIKNFIHIIQKLLAARYNAWKNISHKHKLNKTKANKDTKSWAVLKKPSVIPEYHDTITKGYKYSFINLSHIINKSLKKIWFHWQSCQKSLDLNFSTEETLDLSQYRLTFINSEKLKKIVSEFNKIINTRNSFPKIIISSWILKSARNSLVISKCKLFIQNSRTKKESKKKAFNAFKSITRYQTEFTDIN
jgi:hypothetical protein